MAAYLKSRLSAADPLKLKAQQAVDSLAGVAAAQKRCDGLDGETLRFTLGSKVPTHAAFHDGSPC